MRTPADMPTMIPTTTAADFMEERENHTPAPWEVEKARLDGIIQQTLHVYNRMKIKSAGDAVALTDIILQRFDDGARP